MNLRDPKDFAVAVVAASGVVFSTFLFLDERHAHYEDMSREKQERAQADAKANAERIAMEAALRERILMSESTRYAEVQKFYDDKELAGMELDKAEKIRQQLVKRQQERIGETLKEK